MVCLKNGLWLLVCLLIFLLFSQEINAQQKFRTITVIIDTVDVLNPKEILNEVYVYATHKKSDLPYEIKPYDTGYTKYRYPNYINNFRIYEKLFDSSKINIPIDDGKSYLYIKNLFNLPNDTLRINKVVQWSNCYTDTTFIRKEFYHYHVDSSIREPYKVLFRKRVNKRKCKRKFPAYTTYLVNDKLYTVRVFKSISPAILFTSGQGYLKRRHNRIDPSKIKGKVRRMYFSSRTRQYYNIIELYLEPSGK